MCSCNGLVTGFSKIVAYLWNPSTRRLQIFPAPNKPTQYFEPGIGFGFDPVSGDYKILRIVSDYDLVRNFELYSVNDDSWKDIEVPETLQRFSPFPSSKCVYSKNGVVYVEGTSGVLSFDLKNEEFGFHLYPYRMKNKSRIFDIEGSVAMIFRDTRSVHSLWKLDDVCGNLCWTKKFNLDIVKEKPYGVQCLYLGDGQYVALDDDGYLYYDYDSRNKEIKKFDPPRSCTSLINYTESLVSLEGFEKQDWSGKHRIMEETKHNI